MWAHVSVPSESAEQSGRGNISASGESTKKMRVQAAIYAGRVHV